MTSDADDLILLPGAWLPGRVWDPVVAELERLGRRVVVPALPGVDDGSTTADLDDQLAAVLAAVDAAERPVVVGHSMASALAWLAADRRPTTVVRTVLVGGFPGDDGSTYGEIAPVVDGVMPFPGWEPFAGPDSDDLDAAARARMEEMVVPVPAAVARGTVTLQDERRFDVPVTLVCPEFSPEDVRAWMAAGDLPELTRAADLSLVDLDSGHWPMLSKPAELAGLLDSLAREG